MTSKNYVVERRRRCRHDLRIPVRFRVWGSSAPSQNAESVDISAGGALLETDLLLPVGALLDLRIKLPEEITGQPTTEWRCKSRVIHIALPSLLSHQVQIGVHFDWLDVSPR